MNTKNKVFFIYPATQPFAITAGSRNTDSIVINDKYNFFAYYIAFKAYTTGGVVVNNSLLMQIRVGSQNFFNNPVKIDLIAGDGANANFYPVRLLFRARDNISLDYQNIDAGNGISIYLAFVGFEIRA